MDADIIASDESRPAWERAFYAFLVEKERRSGSRRTVDAYFAHPAALLRDAGKDAR